MPSTDSTHPTDSSPVQADPAARPARQLHGGIHLLAIALAVGFFVVLVSFQQPAISTPDANGYYGQARHILEQQQTWFATESPLQVIPPHWIPDADGRYFSKYPPGLPLLIAGARAVAGANGSLLVDPIMAALTLLGVYYLCRRWIGDGWALLVMALVAVNPAINEQAVFAFAHTTVGFLLVWGLYGLIRWSENYRVGWAVLGGFCFGAIPTVRYGEVLLGLAAMLFVIMHLRATKRCVVSGLAGALAAAVPMGLLAWRNLTAFGSAFKTGYSASHEQTAFGWQHVEIHAYPYLQQLLSEGVGLVFGMALVGLALMCCRPGDRKRGVTLVMIVVPTFLLYLAYYFPPDGASMRFLTPVLFVFPVAVGWLLSTIAQHYRRGAIAAGVVLALVTGAWGLPQSLASWGMHSHMNRQLARATDLLAEHVPPGDIVLADMPLTQDLDFLGTWRVGNASILSGRRGAPGMAGPRGRRRGVRAQRGEDGPRRGDGRAAAGPDNMPRPMAEEMQPWRKKYADLRGPDRADAFAEDVATWAGGKHRVFWVMPESQVDDVLRRLDWFGQFEQIASLEIEDAPPMRGDRGGRGGPGGRRRRPGPGQGGAFGPPGGGPMGGPAFGPPGGGRMGGPGGMIGGPGGMGALQQGGRWVLMEWLIDKPVLDE